MIGREVLAFAWGSLWAARTRSALTVSAMAIGVAAVVMLTWLGESARAFVADQFAAIGVHLVVVLPGRQETVGGMPPILSEIPRDLTIDDALALRKSPSVRRVAPLAFGTAPISYGGKERECPILGSTHEMLAIRHLTLAQGAFLEGVDPHRGAGLCVVGSKVREELFGTGSAIGRFVRIGDRRFRLVGVLAPMGTSLGINIDETVMIAVADALQLFNRASLFRILIQARSADTLASCEADVLAILKQRHGGEEDVTVIRQDAITSTFDRIFVALTLAVAGIAAISLVVAGILVMNVMVVSVTQRTAEVGLLKALGARARDIRAVFLVEAALLSLLGAVLGVAVGKGVQQLATEFYPALHGDLPVYAVAAAVGTALLSGVVFGVVPAQRAARLDPVLALARR